MQSKIVPALHNVMIESGLFNTNDIKSRAYPAHHFAVGEKGTSGSFAHAWIYLLEGRTLEQKIALTKAIKNALKTHLTQIDQLSVDIRDMARDTYQKR